MIRLAALLHDIGHIPFGHTLEDELRHLPPHDDDQRLESVCGRVYKDYSPSEAESDLVPAEPQQDWSLKSLINTLYGTTVQNILGDNSFSPFSVVQAIISKEPSKPIDEGNVEKNEESRQERQSWEERNSELKKRFDLNLCRDIVGNTICADFLDYLYRDWHHLGKPLYQDKRIYQYMEARRYNKQVKIPSGSSAANSTDLQFVINIGSGEKIRHDALTSILQLLEARYELAETVLFHRSKLAVTALLDRCLLEIGKLYEVAEIASDRLPDTLVELLLESSDDALPDVLDRLTTGDGIEGINQSLSEAIDKAESAASTNMGNDLLSGDFVPVVQPRRMQQLIRRLTNDLRHRSIYKLLYKLRYSDIAKNEGADHSGADRVVELYSDTEKRRAFLNGLEALCGLPPCTLVMYCPPTKMNAKVADVKLLIEDDIVTFADYDQRRSQSNLSRGALQTRTQRFPELWSAQVFLRRDLWKNLDKEASHGSTVLRNLEHVVRTFLVQPGPRSDPNIVRMNIQPSIRLVNNALHLEAARAGTPKRDEDGLHDFRFPSGLSFRDPREGEGDRDK